MKSLKKEVKSKIQSRWKNPEEKENNTENNIYNRPQSAQLNNQRTPHNISDSNHPQFQNIINIENARPRSSDSRHSSLAVIKEEDFEENDKRISKKTKIHPNDYFDRNLDTSPTLISRQRTLDSNFSSRPGTGNAERNLKIHDLYSK